jgi:hypothetical protein
MILDTVDKLQNIAVIFQYTLKGNLHRLKVSQYEKRSIDEEIYRSRMNAQNQNKVDANGNPIEGDKNTSDSMISLDDHDDEKFREYYSKKGIFFCFFIFSDNLVKCIKIFSFSLD